MRDAPFRCRGSVDESCDPQSDRKWSFVKVIVFLNQMIAPVASKNYFHSHILYWAYASA
jgi:hypothetical protein